MAYEPHVAEGVITGSLDTAASVEEKSKLKKHFGRFDMLFFLICTLVGVDTLARSRATAPRASRG